MQIAVLNGSPKGENSVTMQYIRYLEQRHRAHRFVRLDVSRRIRQLERREVAFAETIKTIASSDAVIWATPVYYLLVPAQLKRFIELISERDAGDAFAGRYAMALTTSIRFFDNTAHAYLQGVAEDLGQRFFGGYSAEMYDLLSPRKRRPFALFSERFLGAAERGEPTPLRSTPVVWAAPTYEPPAAPAAKAGPAGHRRVLLITDERQASSNVGRMIETFRAALPWPLDVAVLDDELVRSGCLGCLSCSQDNRCVQRDGFRAFYEERVKPADAVIFAGAISNRFLSARFKAFLDRSFYNGHVPTLVGRQVAMLISGPLRQLPETRLVLEMIAQLGGANLVGIVTDEAPDSRTTTALVTRLAADLAQALAHGWETPLSFPAIGGRLLLRDAVWGMMRFPFIRDHQYYTEHGFYDFPRPPRMVRVMYHVASALSHVPRARREIQQRMKQEMIKPFARVLPDGD